ncbi:uncharacterized protein LOC6547528 [Drosophila erecta]|uniref:Uncharacterized protein n=1 Tax=Drosophila erecta TaxID=7220 RepID=B3NJK5_DROER|nr:uncharacterized protein LOC6547528 [Drosophila erecta]EDV55312.1 uncharacterized protein Dere_GG22038 [Drosophila erecta]
MYLCQQLWVLLLWLCFAFLSVHGVPWKWGPSSNSGPHGGPAWNGGEESTDNIVIHSKNNKWRY